MNKKLLIIPSFINQNELLKYDNKSTDVLAFTPAAMLSLDALNIPYKTTDDFYDTEVFRNGLKSLQEKTEIMFSQLDKTCENLISFPYAYTGNIGYFLRMLANLFYLENLSRKIKGIYTKIYLLSNGEAATLSWGKLTYSELQSIPQTRGLENKIQVLKSLLPIEEIPGGSSISPRVSYNLKVKAYVKRFPQRLKKGIKEKRLPTFGRWNMFDSAINKKITLFVMEDGYEIGFLRKHMLDFKFVSSVMSLRRTIPSLPSANYDFRPISAQLEPFLETNFPKLKSQIKSLFLSYHREVVGRLNLFKKSFEELVKQYSPKTLLFSAGTRDVINSIFSYIANKKNIPIIYFQHGGETVFIKDIFQKYTEMDDKVKKTLILNSRVEKEQVSYNGSESLALGSIRYYQSIKENQFPRSNHKVLYCCSPFIFYNYTSLLFNISDKRLYQVNRDILKVCKEKSLSIDIKLHPVQEDYNFHYFRQLINTIKYPKAQIIYGQLAESIIKSYGLIIFDFLGTTVLPLALSLKVPVILYLKDSSVANERVFKDLTERCYVVRNPDQLDEALKRYAADNLACKWSLDIIDRYVYPTENGHPGPHIANYIRSLCGHEKKEQYAEVKK